MAIQVKIDSYVKERENEFIEVVDALLAARATVANPSATFSVEDAKANITKRQMREAAHVRDVTARLVNEESKKGETTLTYILTKRVTHTAKTE